MAGRMAEAAFSCLLHAQAACQQGGARMQGLQPRPWPRCQASPTCLPPSASLRKGKGTGSSTTKYTPPISTSCASCTATGASAPRTPGRPTSSTCRPSPTSTPVSCPVVRHLLLRPVCLSSSPNATAFRIVLLLRPSRQRGPLLRAGPHAGGVALHKAHLAQAVGQAQRQGPHILDDAGQVGGLGCPAVGWRQRSQDKKTRLLASG